MPFKLFVCFVQVGILSIGGGYAAVPVIQSRVVDTFHWITQSQFADLITIAEMTPGPIAVNCATFTGMQIAGLPGALAATAGCILPSCLIVSMMIMIYYKFRDENVLKTVLKTIRPVVVALIASAGISIFKTSVLSEGNVDYFAVGLIIISFVAVKKTKISPVLIMLISGIIYTVFNSIF